MSLVDKVANGAKKGFDWFTFGDGIYRQQDFFYRAVDFDSKSLQWKVFNHTIKKWIECAGLQTVGYMGLAAFMESSHQSATYNNYMCTIGVIGLELLRLKGRMDYVANAQCHFEAQISHALTIDDPLPPQKCSIDGPEPLPFEKDADYWKSSE